MERNSIDEACESTSTQTSIKSEKINCDHVVESFVDDMLEESWFFGNLLLSPKPKEKTAHTNETYMTRCFSDPCLCPCPCSSSTIVPLTLESQRIGDHKLKDKSKNRDRDYVEKRQGNWQREHKKSNGGKVLTRTQTLPPCLRNLEVEIHQDIEGHSDVKMSKLLPPRHDKSISRYRSQRNTDFDGITTNTDGSKDMRRRYLNGRSLRRSTSELEIEEVQGFKDLGFRFDNKDSLSPNVVNILPGLQDKSGEDLGLESDVKRPYLSEAWLVQCCPSPPNWASKSSPEDMKAQIKFWARSVATNVRLEC